MSRHDNSGETLAFLVHYLYSLAKFAQVFPAAFCCEASLLKLSSSLLSPAVIKLCPYYEHGRKIEHEPGTSGWHEAILNLSEGLWNLALRTTFNTHFV